MNITEKRRITHHVTCDHCDWTAVEDDLDKAVILAIRHGKYYSGTKGHPVVQNDTQNITFKTLGNNR